MKKWISCFWDVSNLALFLLYIGDGIFDKISNSEVLK